MLAQKKSTGKIHRIETKTNLMQVILTTYSNLLQVVGDAEDGFTFAAMNKAFQILISSPDVKLYALGMGWVLIKRICFIKLTQYNTYNMLYGWHFLKIKLSDISNGKK